MSDPQSAHPESNPARIRIFEYLSATVFDGMQNARRRAVDDQCPEKG